MLGGGAFEKHAFRPRQRALALGETPGASCLPTDCLIPFQGTPSGNRPGPRVKRHGQHANPPNRPLDVFPPVRSHALQPVRSFKVRGAFNKMARLTPEQLERGVVCTSAGNHAQVRNAS